MGDALQPWRQPQQVEALDVAFPFVGPVVLGVLTRQLSQIGDALVARERVLRTRRGREKGDKQQAYADAPFVRLTGTTLPEIKHVVHTNFCDVGWRVDEERSRIVLVAVIDNLVKGAAGSAVQNLNIALGLDERTGLL